MTIWQQYGHLWPQAVVVALTTINVFWKLTVFVGLIRQIQDKTLFETVLLLMINFLFIGLYLSLDAHRIATALRPNLTRAKACFYVWIAENVLGTAFVMSVLSWSNGDLEVLQEAQKELGHPPIRNAFIMLAPVLLGFALWKLQNQLKEAEQREQQQQRQQRQQQLMQQQQGVDAQHMIIMNPARNQPQQQLRRVYRRQWIRYVMGSLNISSFCLSCWALVAMPSPLSYTELALNVILMYIQAFGLLAIYRRSIPSIRLYICFLVAISCSDIGLELWSTYWGTRSSASSQSTTTTTTLTKQDQDQKFLENIDLDSILSAKPKGDNKPTTQPSSSMADFLRMDEFSLNEVILMAIVATVLDIWMCLAMIRDIRDVEAAEHEPLQHVQAQPQPPQLQPPQPQPLTQQSQPQTPTPTQPQDTSSFSETRILENTLSIPESPAGTSGLRQRTTISVDHGDID